MRQVPLERQRQIPERDSRCAPRSSAGGGQQFLQLVLAGKRPAVAQLTRRKRAGIPVDVPAGGWHKNSYHASGSRQDVGSPRLRGGIGRCPANGKEPGGRQKIQHDVANKVAKPVGKGPELEGTGPSAQTRKCEPLTTAFGPKYFPPRRVAASGSAVVPKRLMQTMK